MQTAEIRRRFLEHFEQRGHTVVPSASLISPDPSLLFTVAGMVPFIPYLTGREPAPYPRATSVQKCVRTLDIEEVGKTTRHGTFFQMNGNFSFGDYFKEGAIQLRLGAGHRVGRRRRPGLRPRPDLGDRLPRRRRGRRRLAPASRACRRSGSSAWAWTTTTGRPARPGPAGPCSEIYYDRGPEYGPDGGPAVDTAGDRFLEIWNLVFMQYERGSGRGQGLPDPRRAAEEEHRHRHGPGAGGLPAAGRRQHVRDRRGRPGAAPRRRARRRHATARDHEADVRLRVVADHVRSGLMLIGDGVTPGNEGRGYILRRLLRRAVRSMKLLGVDDATLPELLPVSRDAMSASYPELATDFARISGVAYAEEEAFRRTLTAGTTLFDTAVAQAKKAGTPALSGDQAFSLHDTYGFPIDVTLEMAAEQGVTVDEAGLPRADEGAARAGPRRRPRQAHRLGRRRRLPAAAGRARPHRLAGLRHPAHRLPGARRSSPTTTTAPAWPAPGEITRVVLDRTPFYAESGGQVADAGDPHLGRRPRRGDRRPAAGQGPGRPPGAGARGRAARGHRADRRGRLRVAAVGLPGALGHARGARARCARCSARRRCSRAPTTGPATCGWTSPGRARSAPQQRTDIEDVANAAVRADHRVTACT